jgi:hypothetical protein
MNLLSPNLAPVLLIFFCENFRENKCFLETQPNAHIFKKWYLFPHAAKQL